MRILIGSKYKHNGKRRIGGVQTWGKTVGRVFEKMGLEVEHWEDGDPLPTRGFDVGILSNWKFTQPLAAKCRKRVIVCHGIIPHEAPPKDNVVFTSEGVRAHWGGKGRPVVRQPIDTEFWSPEDKERVYLLRFSYRAGLSMSRSVASHLGLRYFHARNLDPEPLRSMIRGSAVVYATGRASLEAMSCGIPTVIVDHRSSYQAALMATGPIEEAMRNNYSGRGGVMPDFDRLLKATNQAMSRGSMRDHILEFHDAEKIARELVSLAR